MISRPDTKYILYKVTMKNFRTCFVIAEHPTEAYAIVRKFLDDNDLCFTSERELHLIEPIASNAYYTPYELLLIKEAK